MKGSRRRVLGCVATAAAGAVMLVSAATASAQKPEKVGDGVKTGQLGVQLFNYGGFISNGGGLGPNPPALNISPGCTTSTSAECRWERLERLFALPGVQGRHERRALRPRELPGQRRHREPGPLSRAARQVRAARRRLARRHERGQLGRSHRRREDPRRRLPRLRRLPEPGHRLATPTRSLPPRRSTASASASIEAGLGPAYHHNHQDEFAFKYVDNGVLKPAWEVIMDNTDARYSVAEIDVKWSSDALDDPSGLQTAALINKYGTRVQLLHLKDAQQHRRGRLSGLGAVRAHRQRRARLPADPRGGSGQGPLLPPGARRWHADRRRDQPDQPARPEHGRRRDGLWRTDDVPLGPGELAGVEQRGPRGALQHGRGSADLRDGGQRAPDPGQRSRHPGRTGV